MRKLLLILFALFTAHSVKAVNYYTFSHSTATYTEISSPTLVTATFLSDEYVLNLGVSFKMFGYDFGMNGNDLKILRTGAIVGMNAASDRLFALDGFLVKGFIAGDGTSSISYALDGTAGSRILKVRFKNVGMEGGDENDFVNFQMWLYEDGSKMEVRIGPHQIADPTKVFVSGVTGPSVGIFLSDLAFTTDYEVQFLDGNSANPTLSEELFNNLDDVPAANTVYTFAHSTAGNGESITGKIRSWNVYPNPGRGKYTIIPGNEEKLVSVEVFSLNGDLQRVFLMQGLRAQPVIDISDMAPGMYMLMCRTSEEINHVLIQKY